MLVICGSLLRGIGHNVSRPDPLAQELCCLPRAKIKGIADQMPKLIKPIDNYPFVMVHMGMNKMAMSTITSIRADCEALER